MYKIELQMISKRKENQIKPVGIVIQIIFENQSEKFPKEKTEKIRVEKLPN